MAFGEIRWWRRPLEERGALHQSCRGLKEQWNKAPACTEKKKNCKQNIHCFEAQSIDRTLFLTCCSAVSARWVQHKEIKRMLLMAQWRDTVMCQSKGVWRKSKDREFLKHQLSRSKIWNETQLRVQMYSRFWFGFKDGFSVVSSLKL